MAFNIKNNLRYKIEINSLLKYTVLIYMVIIIMLVQKNIFNIGIKTNIHKDQTVFRPVVITRAICISEPVLRSLTSQTHGKLWEAWPLEQWTSHEERDQSSLGPVFGPLLSSRAHK